MSGAARDHRRAPSQFHERAHYNGAQGHSVPANKRHVTRPQGTCDGLAGRNCCQRPGAPEFRVRRVSGCADPERRGAARRVFQRLQPSATSARRSLLATARTRSRMGPRHPGRRGWRPVVDVGRACCSVSCAPPPKGARRPHRAAGRISRRTPQKPLFRRLLTLQHPAQ